MLVGTFSVYHPLPIQTDEKTSEEVVNIFLNQIGERGIYLTDLHVKAIRKDQKDLFKQIYAGDDSFLKKATDAYKRALNSSDSMLKIIEGTTANVPPNTGRKHPQQDFIQLDTRNILFICGGAFSHLDEIVRRRLQRRSGLGFVAGEEQLVQPRQGSTASEESNGLPLPENLSERQRELQIRRMERESREESHLLHQVVPDDLLAFGLIPEFIGRLPVFVSLDTLDRRTLVRILTEPKNSIVRQFQRLFAMDKVELAFEPDALDAVATEAFLRKTGARGLRSIVEEGLLDVMFEIPSREDVVRCVVNREVFTEDKLPKLFGRQGQPVSLGQEFRSAA